MEPKIYESLLKLADVLQFLGKFEEARVVEAAGIRLKELEIEGWRDAANAMGKLKRTLVVLNKLQCGCMGEACTGHSVEAAGRGGKE